MKEYTEKRVNASRILDNDSKVSRQAPLLEILQAYKGRLACNAVQHGVTEFKFPFSSGYKSMKSEEKYNNKNLSNNVNRERNNNKIQMQIAGNVIQRDKAQADEYTPPPNKAFTPGFYNCHVFTDQGNWDENLGEAFEIHDIRGNIPFNTVIDMSEEEGADEIYSALEKCIGELPDNFEIRTENKYLYIQTQLKQTDADQFYKYKIGVDYINLNISYQGGYYKIHHFSHIG